jgi:drug/metabolite transporter (DMT)-like permease
MAMITTLTWGVWGALVELPERAGLPATLGYAIWALTMIPCAWIALRRRGGRLERDRRSLLVCTSAGLLGAGGQLILFEALRLGPAYIVFPIVSLYPALTIVLSVAFLRERASRRQWAGIALSLPAIALISQVAGDDASIQGYGWLALAAGVFVMWGAQAFVLKLATQTVSAEGVFAYMAVTAVALVPVAVAMTSFDTPINWGWNGPYVAALIHVLNSLGALTMVYALREGKAIVVVPMTALAPVITIALSLALYGRAPLPAQGLGMGLAVIAIYLVA